MSFHKSIVYHFKTKQDQVFHWHKFPSIYSPFLWSSGLLAINGYFIFFFPFLIQPHLTILHSPEPLLSKLSNISCSPIKCPCPQDLWNFHTWSIFLGFIGFTLASSSFSQISCPKHDFYTSLDNVVTSTLYQELQHQVDLISPRA